MKKFSIMLDGTRFAYCKLARDTGRGDPQERVGAVQDWCIRPDSTSMLPREIFYYIQKKVRSATSRSPGDFNAIEEALVEAAWESDCEARTDHPNGRAYVWWMKDTRPFVCFVIDDDERIKSGEAPLRFRVDTQGYFHAQDTGVKK